MIADDDGRSLWRIHGVDYDMHSFVQQHPGGALAIRLGEGIECTALFESYHRPGAAFRALGKHRVAAGPAKPMPPMSAFKTDLDLTVQTHFAGQGRRAHKATWSHWLLCAVFFGLELWCWVGWARGSLLATALLPIFFWLVTVNVMHDASHFAFASRPWINELCAMTGAPLLCESITWYHQHVMSHHTHANEVAGDVDLQHMVPLKLHSQACFLPAA